MKIEKKVWIIEGTHQHIRDWYICWHEFFDTSKKAQDRITELGWRNQGLKNEDGTKAKFRVRRYTLQSLP